MKFLAGIALILNLIVIAILFAGFLVHFKSPKNKAMFGYALVGSMVFYLIALLVFIVSGVFFRPDIMLVVEIFCLISPFFIGRLVEFKTLKKYTIIQILCFALGLIPLACYL